MEYYLKNNFNQLLVTHNGLECARRMDMFSLGCYSTWYLQTLHIIAKGSPYFFGKFDGGWHSHLRMDLIQQESDLSMKFVFDFIIKETWEERIKQSISNSNVTSNRSLPLKSIMKQLGRSLYQVEKSAAVKENW